MKDMVFFSKILNFIQGNRHGLALVNTLRDWRASVRRSYLIWRNSSYVVPEQVRAQVLSKIYSLTNNGYPTYFGYYDKIPFCVDGEKILATSFTTKKDWGSQANQYPLQVGVFKWSDIIENRPRFYPIGITETWSWQQGCMLQWFPSVPENLVIYNKLVDNKYGSVLQNVETQKIEARYNRPIYAIDHQGLLGVSLDFSRLEQLRPGYGYSYLGHNEVASFPETEGIHLVNLDTCSSDLLISLRQLAVLEPLPSMKEAIHYVNHMHFSPDSKKMLFLHLWQPSAFTPRPRSNRLMIYDFESESLSVLDSTAEISHYNWLSDKEIVCFRFPKQDVPGYFVYRQNIDKTWSCTRLSGLNLSRDGHPSLSLDGQWIVSDTLPDRRGDQELYIFSMDRKITLELGRFYSPYRYRGPQRCDLHPRWDHSGSRVCFDSTYRGRRSMCIAHLQPPTE